MAVSLGIEDVSASPCPIPVDVAINEKKTAIQNPIETKRLQDLEADMDSDSGYETCGFVCHVVTTILAVSYTAWIGSFYYSRWSQFQNLNAETLQQLHHETMLHFPLPPAWTSLVPTLAVGLFFSVPIVYTILNATSVAPVYSLESIQDKYTVQSPPPRSIAPTCARESETINVSYFRNPSDNQSGSKILLDHTSYMNKNGIPEICDIDVANINNLASLLLSRDKSEGLG